MSKYFTPEKVSGLFFVDNNEDSSTSDRYLDDDDCSDYVPSDNDNEKGIIPSDPEYAFEDNNHLDDNAVVRDANDKNITKKLLRSSNQKVVSKVGQQNRYFI